MNEDTTSNLRSLLRAVRQSRGLTTAELAKKAGITPSAITQYEKCQASISVNKLKTIASFIDLNPSYFDTQSCNPFWQANRDAAICMNLPITRDGHAEPWIVLDMILKSNRRAIFSFMRPPFDIVEASLQMKRWRNKGRAVYAILVRDNDDNLFLFKDRKDCCFDCKNILMQVDLAAANRGEKTFITRQETLSLSLYEHIRNGTAKRKHIEEAFLSFETEDYRSFLLKLLSYTTQESGDIAEAKYDDMKKSIASSSSDTIRLAFEEVTALINHHLLKSDKTSL